MLKFGALAVASALVLFHAPRARADVRTEARRHFRAGMALIQEGQVDAGVEELQVAYDTLPHPNVLYNIARAYAEVGRYEEALEYFEMYLESDPPDREEVVTFISAIQTRLEAAQGPTEGPVQPEGPVTTGGGGGPIVPAVDVSDEDIRALEDAATQVEVLYETTGTPALRERAERLRELAQSLREGGAGGDGASDGQGAQDGQVASTGTDTGTAGGDGGGEIGVLGGSESRTGVFEEEIVSASRFAESPVDAPNSTTTITAQDIRMSGLTNIGEILRRAAGVSVMSTTVGHTDVNVRGLNERQANKTLVLVNGRTIRLDFLATTFFAIVPFNVRDIERIEVIRGPAAALYGADAFSGIINIILKDPAQADSYVAAGAGNAGQLLGAASVSGRQGRVAYRLGASYEQADHFQQLLEPGRVDARSFYPDTTSAYEVARFNGEFRVGLGENQDYLIQAGTGITTAPQFAIQGKYRLRELATTDLSSAQTHFQFNTPQGIQLRAYWNAFDVLVRDHYEPIGGLPVAGSFTSNVADVELSFSRRFHFLVDHNFSIGTGYRFKTLDWSWGDNNTEHHFNFYVQDVLTLHERLRLTLSARLDRHPLLANVRFSPRGALVARLTEASAIRATVGTAFRSPSFLESYINLSNRTPVRGATARAVGNRNISPERILSMEVGYSNQDTDYFALEINAYLNYVDNLNALTQITTTPLSEATYIEDVEAFPLGATQFDNIPGRYRQVGGELGLRVFPVDGLDVYANYALNETTALGTPPPELRVLFQDQRTSMHKVNAGVQYRSPIGLDVSFDFHWVSEQIWAEQFDNPETGVEYRLTRIAPYALLNARVGWRLLDDDLEFAISAWNLLGDNFRMHPFGQRVDRRILGQVDVRF